MDVVQGNVVFQHLGTDHALRFKYLGIGFFRQTQVFPQAVVLPDGLYLIILAVPIFGAAINTGAYGGLFTVNGYTAEYGGRTVSPHFAAVDVGQ
jgi:hypothetical protein